jgi:hypothetical protein
MSKYSMQPPAVRMLVDLYGEAITDATESSAVSSAKYRGALEVYCLIFGLDTDKLEETLDRLAK